MMASLTLTSAAIPAPVPVSVSPRTATNIAATNTVQDRDSTAEVRPAEVGVVTSGDNDDGLYL